MNASSLYMRAVVTIKNMRKIQKTFSLETMTSRMPSVLPAYRDNALYYFDDNSLKDRDYEYPSNYGMIPVNIALSGVTVDDDALSASTDWSGVTMGCSGATISFERLSKWYYDFKEYYHLLNDYGHCSRTYSSATEYYKYESNTRYSNQMVYGTFEETYIELDRTFERRGGVVDVENIASGATDIGFYKWICDNIVPTYYISKEYTDYWERKKLYYPDVIKWIAWFSERLDYETKAEYTQTKYSGGTKEVLETEHWNCRNSAITDCCDCEEYFNRGGEREYDRMLDWYNNVQSGISANNQSISGNEECFIPTMDDKIQLYNSLDDLGQFSIFSREYELGIDYRTIRTESGETETTIHYEEGNTHSGTVMVNSGETMLLVNGNGFCFSPYSMEKVYDDTAWESYTEHYINQYPNEFASSAYTYYAFDDENVMYTGTSSGAVISAMSSAYTYDIEEVNAILIDGTLYPIAESEYGEYDPNNQYMSGKTFFVYRDGETETPYTMVNGKKVYAEWYPFGDEPCYYFTFFKSEGQKSKKPICGISDRGFNINNYKHFERKRSESADTISYISYQGQIFEVDEESGVTIDDIDYPIVSGYAYSDTNELMYCVSGNVVDSEYLLEIPKSKIEGNKIIIGLDYEPQIYNAKELTGHTVSKLTSLESTDILVDDIGNNIDGKYNPNKIDIYNHQPPQGSELELLYQVGNTANIRRFKLTESADTTVTENYFVGDIITDMVFYYKDINGNIAESGDTTTRFAWENSSLETIHKSQEARATLEEANMIFDGNDIYCDVTYYIGATLVRHSGEEFKLAYLEDEKYNYGVEYKETVKFVKENREYYLKKEINKQIPTTFNSVSAHSVSYPIYVYKLKQEMTDIEADEYDTYFQSPLASFKTEINLIDGNLSTNFSNYDDMSNNIDVTPTFKQEYMLGISSLENIDSDIYIERGINAAFERHLKLGEVTSMEALEQFGNGYFKIINN